MTIYILMFFFLLCADFLTLDPSVTHLVKRQRNICFIIIWACLTFFIMVFKDYSVGSDTFGYISIYNNSIIGDGISWNNEIGYVLINKFFRSLNIPFRIFWGVYSFFIISIFSWFIFKHSIDMMISVCGYMALGLFPMSMSGIRQMLCVGLFLIAIQQYIDFVSDPKRNPKKIVILLLLFIIGSTIHSSMIFLLPVLLLCNIKLPKLFYWIAIFICLVLSVFGEPFVKLIVSYTQYSFYLSSYHEREYLVIIRSMVIIISFFIACITSWFRFTPTPYRW